MDSPFNKRKKNGGPLQKVLDYGQHLLGYTEIIYLYPSTDFEVPESRAPFLYIFLCLKQYLVSALLTGRCKDVGEFKEDLQISGLGHWVGLGYISRDGENWKKPYLGLGGDESVLHILMWRFLFFTYWRYSISKQIHVSGAQKKYLCQEFRFESHQ